jgi:hypothetical protein
MPWDVNALGKPPLSCRFTSGLAAVRGLAALRDSDLVYVGLGSCVTRIAGPENLDGDAKGKGTSGSNREAESTNAPARGGLLRSSEEAG